MIRFTRLLFIVALLILCADSHAQVLPYFDRVEMKDGTSYTGVLLDITDHEVKIRVSGRVQIKPKREVARIRYREELYIEYGKAEVANGQYETSLIYFQKVRDNDRTKDEKWKKQAEKEIIASLTEMATKNYQDVVFLTNGNLLIGRILDQNADRIKIKLKLGTVEYQQKIIKMILRKEAATLAHGDKILAQGQIEDAIGHYTRVHADRETPRVWKDRAGAKLASALLTLSTDAHERGDLVQARQLLTRAASVAPADETVARRLAEVRSALKKQMEARLARAKKLVGDARALLKRKAYQDAYPKLVEAQNLHPEMEGLRDLLDDCLANIQVLSYGDFDDPGTLDPITSQKRVEKRIGQFMFNGLITRDSKEEFVPELTERVTMNSTGMTYNFWLNRGVLWADGTEVTARDVEFTLTLLTNPKTHNHNPTFAKFIKKVEVVNPYQLKIHLKRPFYKALSLFSFKVVPRRGFKERFLDRKNPFCRSPLGSGPFAYKGGLGSRVIEFGRNLKFGKKNRPYLSGVRLKRYQDRQSARNDLERGELHLLTELRPLDVDFFEKQRNRFTVRQYRARTIYFLAFNYRKPIFGNRDLRRAIAKVIDRQSILEQFFNAGNPLKRRGGQAHTVITGPFPYNSWAYNDNVAEYTYEKDYAATLLASVMTAKGWTRSGGAGVFGGRRYWTRGDNELELKLKYPKGDRNVEKACIFIADSLKKIGVKVRLAQKAPRDLHDEVFNQHDFDMVYSSYTFDDTYDVFPLFDPDRRQKGGTNFAGYVNPGLVSLFTKMQTTQNPNRIRALSREIHRRVHDECTFVFLWQLDQYAAHTNELRNVQIHPYHLFSEVDGWKILKGPR